MHRPFQMLLGAALVILASCSSSSPDAKVSTTDHGSSSEHTRSGGAVMSAESEVGGMNEEEVTQTFQHAQSRLMHCYEKGVERLPYLSGKIRFFVRIDEAGKAKSVHVSDSTLGDRETERCMVGILRGATWPSPKGGKEGHAESGFALEPQSDVREAVAWQASDAGKGVDEAKKVLASCRSSSGAHGLKATVYVDTEGHVESVGVSGSDPAAEAAADCVVSAMKAVTFNSPGSYSAKLTIGE